MGISFKSRAVPAAVSFLRFLSLQATVPIIGMGRRQEEASRKTCQSELIRSFRVKSGECAAIKKRSLLHFFTQNPQAIIVLRFNNMLK